ncbi:LamG-like jellyroll fold domain-containing protein [Paenibacillus sp. LHD-117]|uniref:LamG-like jellyroll fold domain-containing protein n=1 Tax=Paenibacillus sp. LHD-117 TaxID=3071412 RepID=UPI0027E1B8F6|nr:LamG-like jellyroll fold domain-containing protein [Paenibacillus sp. LHD-117]MDQ6417911.1 LamG-like jellyroll fold domain-containing protein [Paenibacillus sp. LHD-117]
MQSEWTKKFGTLRKSCILLLIAAMLLPAFGPSSGEAVYAAEEQEETGIMDQIVFGSATSESGHNFRGEFTSTIAGLLGEPARISNPRVPASGAGGDLTFTMEVDPYLRNYFTVKFSGEETSTVSMVNIGGEQIGYISYGDYESIGKGWTLPNRFFYHTIMLPLESTAGKETVEITIRSINPYGNMTASTRGYYNAYTHTQAYIDVEGERQGNKFKPQQNADTMLAPDLSAEEKQARVDGYMQELVKRFNSLSSSVDVGAGNKLSIIRYQDDLKFYASALKYDWSPAQTAEQKKAALQRIFKTIDNHVKDYYGNTRLVLRGGHQGDWGGYYGALGEALYIVENLIKDESIYGESAFNAFLDQPFVTGTVESENALAGVDWTGGELTRREAWERALKANFDFARARLSYIYNQVYYTYEGAWEAHEGLRLIGSGFYEGKERSQRILLEALGIEPFLGEEVLVGPNGEELDLYHSLFYHDGSAVFTDDFAQIVGKGLAKSKLDPEGRLVRRLPYGEHYTGLTEAGLTRENGYVANYGEAANYLLSYFYKTLDHPGDEEMNDDILKAALKSIHARGFVRTSSLDESGRRVMRAEQVTDERNPALIGFAAYGARIGSGMGLQFASLEMEMAQNEQRYGGEEWAEYWQYAREAVGFVQQQLADRQLLQLNDFGTKGTMSTPDYRLAETYRYVTEERADYDRFGGSAMAGVVLPQTDFDYYKPEELSALGVDPSEYEQFAWADIDNMYVSVKDGDLRMLGSLFYRNRGMAANGRLHVITDEYDHIVQIATNNRFRYEDYYLREGTINWDFQSDREDVWSGAPQALAGEALPSSYQPGVGTVTRDNFETDHPYAGYPELQTSRYGSYYIVFNTTRAEYGNEMTFDVELPADYSGSTVLDLITGASVPVVHGKVTVAPKSAMVLKLATDIELAPKPFHVDFVHALAGNDYVGLSWKTTSGGESYTIKRSESEEGPYETIVEGVTGNFYKDTEARNGRAYYFKVSAVNANGSGWDSYRAIADLSAPASGLANTEWRDDRIGTSTGSATAGGSSVAIQSANGTGFGSGDDYNLYQRDINDSLHFVSKTAAGSSMISARIDTASGEASGVMLRDRLTPDKARYIYFGADENGDLVLQNRTRVSIIQWSNKVASPKKTEIERLTAAEYPYVKLMRDHDSQTVYAFASKDGTDWRYVAKMSTLLPYGYYAGVASSDSAVFNEVSITETRQGSLTPFVAKEQDQATLYWNKPKQASWFHVYRTTDEAAGFADPELTPGSAEPVDGSPWELVLTSARATSYEERGLRYGSVFYKILPVHGDGTPQPFYGASIAADSIDAVLETAENLPSADYTKASYYLYRQELARIRDAKDEAGADLEALIEQIYDADEMLVSVRTLLAKIEMEPSMAKASEKYWGNDNIGEEQNAWYLFDENPNTIAHTRSAVSWVDVDYGEGNGKAIDTIRYLPRRTHVNRVNGTVFQGSNDKQNWTELYTIPSTSVYQWYSASSANGAPYRYIRIYDGHNGFVNFEEIEFYEMPEDRTLLLYWLNEAENVVSEHYTEESLQLLEQTVASAETVHEREDATQYEIDEAAEALREAVQGLEYADGIPVLAPIGDKTAIAGNELGFTVREETEQPGAVIGVAGLPEEAAFDAETGVFTWTPALSQGGVHTIVFTVTAGNASTSRTVAITVKGEPSFPPVGTVTAEAKKELVYDLAASDPTGEPLTYSAGELPEGAAFIAGSGQLRWTPDYDDYGSNPIVFTVSNGRFSVSRTIDFNVTLSVRQAADYTKGSYYLYAREVDRIVEEIAKPEADFDKLVAELEAAEGGLVRKPLSLYSFENNADNAYGSTHGAVTGIPVYAEGKTGQAIDLNGSNQHVTLPAGHALSGYDEMTVAAWVNWRGGNQWQRLFDFGNNTNQYLFLSPRSGNNTLRFAIKNGGAEQLVQTSQLAANEWVHVAVTLGAGKAKLYVNGEEKASAAITLKPSDFRPSVLYIGKSMFNDPLFNGQVDEFLLYNTALGAEEIRDIYAGEPSWLDTSLLDYALIEASDVNQELYTAESYAALQQAVAAAQQLPGEGQTSQTQIDEAAEALLAALDGLQPIGTNEPMAAVIEGTDIASANGPVELTIGLSDGDITPFTVLDLIIQYDPDRLAFPTRLGEEGQQFLAEEALETLRESFQPIGAIKPEQGRIRITGFATENITDSGDLFLLRGMVKGDAPSGATVVSLSDFSVAHDGEAFEVDTSAASMTLQVHLADKTALRERIEQAEQLASSAVPGSAPGQYPQPAIARLNEAIAAAEAVLVENGATAEMVSAAAQSLQAAITAFLQSAIPTTTDPLDKAELNAAIAEAESVYASTKGGNKVGQYPEADRAALRTAVDAAVQSGNTAASQSAIDQAAETLRLQLAQYRQKIVTLVPGQSGVTIRDLSIVARYMGTKLGEAGWNEIEKADVLGTEEIDIRTLAAIARMILEDWLEGN